MGVSANRSSAVEKSLRWVNIRLSRARGERDVCVLDDPLGAFIARARTVPPAGSSRAQWRCRLAAMAFGFETDSRGTRFSLRTASHDSRWGTRKVKTVAPGVRGRNLKRKRDGFLNSIDGDVRVGARRQRTPKGARAPGCAREHAYHRETSAEGTSEGRRARWAGRITKHSRSRCAKTSLSTLSRETVWSA